MKEKSNSILAPGLALGTSTIVLGLAFTVAMQTLAAPASVPEQMSALSAAGDTGTTGYRALNKTANQIGTRTSYQILNSKDAALGAGTGVDTDTGTVVDTDTGPYQYLQNWHGLELVANRATSQLQYDNQEEKNSSASADTSRPSRASQLLAATSSIGSEPLALNSHTIVDIAEGAAPSVVNIEVVRHDDRTTLMPFTTDPSNPFGGGQFFLYNGRKFYPFSEPLVPMPKPAPGSKKPDAVGSGMVIREDGYILTNAHVVKGATDIRVNLNDKRSFAGQIVGTDSFSDLAVVKINAKGLPAIKLGSSANLRPGEFVVAIGDPLSFDHTVTFGIISAVGRTITDVNGNINFIQTDAAINPGNSGGPLLNLKGEVIAINTAIDKVGQNIGFSIPVDVAKTVAEDLIHNRPISRPWIGIGVRPLTDAKLKSLGLKPGQTGVSVELVYETSPAQAAGIEPGDVILKIDGKSVSEGKSVQDIVRAHKVKDVLSVTYFRAGEEKTSEMTIGEFPELGEQPKAEKETPTPKQDH